MPTEKRIFDLYTTTGQNTDAAITQKGITDALSASATGITDFTQELGKLTIKTSAGDFEADLNTAVTVKIGPQLLEDTNFSGSALNHPWQVTPAFQVGGGEAKVTPGVGAFAFLYQDLLLNQSGTYELTFKIKSITYGVLEVFVTTIDNIYHPQFDAPGEYKIYFNQDAGNWRFHFREQGATNVVLEYAYLYKVDIGAVYGDNRFVSLQKEQDIPGPKTFLNKVKINDTSMADSLIITNTNSAAQSSFLLKSNQASWSFGVTGSSNQYAANRFFINQIGIGIALSIDTDNKFYSDYYAQFKSVISTNLQGAGGRLLQTNSSGEIVADPNAPKWDGTNLAINGYLKFAQQAGTGIKFSLYGGTADPDSYICFDTALGMLSIYTVIFGVRNDLLSFVTSVLFRAPVELIDPNYEDNINQNTAIRKSYLDSYFAENRAYKLLGTTITANNNGANDVSGLYAAVLSGEQNGTTANYVVVVGGAYNLARALYGFIGNGLTNTVSQNAPYGYIGNGQQIKINRGSYASIINGLNNTVAGKYIFISGGESNSILSGLENSTQETINCSIIGSVSTVISIGCRNVTCINCTNFTVPEYTFNATFQNNKIVRNIQATPTTLKTTVKNVSNIWVNGELQGIQPTGSIPGMQFSDDNFEYEFTTGKDETNGFDCVWIRLRKSSFIPNSAEPATNPNGGVQWVENGALWYKGSNGTKTKLADA